MSGGVEVKTEKAGSRTFAGNRCRRNEFAGGTLGDGSGALSWTLGDGSGTLGCTLGGGTVAMGGSGVGNVGGEIGGVATGGDSTLGSGSVAMGGESWLVDTGGAAAVGTARRRMSATLAYALRMGDPNSRGS